MGKVIVSIKPTSATGAAGVTRYIAESKRNPEKEGLGPNEPRPLFSYTEDKLTYLEANRILQIPTDAQAQKEDVIHMVISPRRDTMKNSAKPGKNAMTPSKKSFAKPPR